MTDQIAYQEYIQRRYNAFCKTVIRCAALDKILKLKRQWERQVSLDYLMNEKFVQFAASEPDEEYPFTVCGQTVLLCNAALADAISVLPEQTREEILRYYFLRQPQRVIGASNRKIKSSVPTMLSMVGLAAKYKSLPKQLSGGEQQRVAIARALINEPKILLADEPTGNLDNHNAWEIMKLLEEINSRGTTVVVVTHNLEIVKAMNKRVITMKKGVVVEDSEGDYSDED